MITRPLAKPQRGAGSPPGGDRAARPEPGPLTRPAPGSPTGPVPPAPPGPGDPTTRALSLLILVSAVGNGLFLAVSTLWFTRGLGFSAAQVGLALSCAGACGVLVSYPAGRAADRFGAARVLGAVLVLQCLASACLVMVATYPAFLLLACALVSGSRANGTLRSALYAQALPAAGRTRALGLLRAVNNVGIGAGAALGAGVVALGGRGWYEAAILADALSFLAALLPLRAVRARTGHPGRVAAGARGRGAWRDAPYLVVTGLNALVNSLYVVLEVALPLWLVGHTRAPGALVGVLLVVNTALVVLLQVRATRGKDDVAAAVRAFRSGGVLVAVSCGAATAAAWLPPLAAAAVLLGSVVLLTLGEVTSQAGSWTLGYALAPADAQGTYQGVYQTGISLTQAVGPVAVTTLVLPHGAWGWGLLGALFCAAALAMGPAVRWAGRGREPLSRATTARGARRARRRSTRP